MKLIEATPKIIQSSFFITVANYQHNFLQLGELHLSTSLNSTDVVLRQVDKQKYLGVMFDTRLSWTHQVSNVCKKMAYYLHLINLHKHCLSPHLLKLLLESLVLSHLS